MTKRPVLLLPACLVLLATACGGGGSSAQPSTTQTKVQASPTPSLHGQPISGSLPCKPEGTTLTVKAIKYVKFSTKCLAAPADQPFTIEFVNHDVRRPNAFILPIHNIGIGTDRTFQEEVFVGNAVQSGSTTTYRVGALPTGIYFFRCDLHIWMKGTFVAA